MVRGTRRGGRRGDDGLKDTQGEEESIMKRKRQVMERRRDSNEAKEGMKSVAKRPARKHTEHGR